MSTSTQRGNVLFLILIAVALFAALSYTVSQSTRGQGDTSRDTLQIKVSELLQQAFTIKSHVQRYYALGTHDQMYMSEDAYNPSGTVHSAGGGTATGKTEGIVNPASGIPKLLPPIELYDTGSGLPENYFGWATNYSAISSNGVDFGTSLSDDNLYLVGLTKSACEAINKALQGTTAISPHTLTGPFTTKWYRLNRDGTISQGNDSETTAAITNPVMLPACVGNGPGDYRYVDILRAN